MKAQWNNTIIAESDATVIIEGNHYFPKESIKMEYLKESHTQSSCPWKGCASYYNIIVNGETHEDAAWYYAEPSPLTSNIKNHIAFWEGVEITSE